MDLHFLFILTSLSWNKCNLTSHHKATALTVRVNLQYFLNHSYFDFFLFAIQLTTVFALDHALFQLQFCYTDFHQVEMYVVLYSYYTWPLISYHRLGQANLG